MDENNCRCLKCCFKKYWIAGLILSIILGAINSVIGMLSSYLINLQAQIPPIIFGVTMIAVTIIFIVTVPWIVGRLIKWSYETFIH